MELTLNIILSTVFFSAFYSKIFNLEEFAWEISNLKIVRLKVAKYVAIIVLLFELILAVFLLAPGLIEKIKQVLAFGLLIIFLGIAIRNSTSKKNDCGCFGQNHIFNRNPILRNLTLITITVLDFFYASSEIDAKYLFLIFILIVIVAVSLDNLRLYNLLMRRS